MLKALDDLVEELARGWIEPMRVFKHHQDRATRRKSVKPRNERPEQERLPLLGRHVRRDARSRARNSKEIGNERNRIACQLLAVLTQERFEALEPLFRRVIWCKPRRPLKLRNQRKEWAVQVMRRASIANKRDGLGF